MMVVVIMSMQSTRHQNDRQVSCGVMQKEIEKK